MSALEGDREVIACCLNIVKAGYCYFYLTTLYLFIDHPQTEPAPSININIFKGDNKTVLYGVFLKKYQYNQINL